MRQSWRKTAGPARRTRGGEQARVRTALLAVLGLAACVGIGSVWFYHATGRRPQPGSEETSGQGLVSLSAGTRAVLQRLQATVEIRFYALLDRPGVPAALPILAARVDQLLSAYQQEANGKVKVVRFDSRSDFKTAVAAAAADGIKPFNLDQGDSCYLGLAVVHHGQKESFPQLSPEWEQALESDLSRAIARLINAPSQAEITSVSHLDAALAAEVKRQIPDVASVSMAEGTRILREAALRDFKAMASEMERQIRAAEERVNAARIGNSETEQQAALQQLQQVQADHAAKLKEITARSSAQIEALRRLKEGAP